MPEFNENEFTVEGIIYDEFNVPLPNVKIQLFDKDLRTEQLLGETVTKEKGQYIVKYTSAKFSRAEKVSADIILKVFAQSPPTVNRHFKKLGESSVHFNVTPTYKLDFKVDGTVFTGISEFDALSENITPLLQGQDVKLFELTEQDIDFLSKETTIDATFINFFSLAALHVKSLQPTKSKIPADVFYCLLRLHFPPKLNELFLVQSKSIENGVIDAIKNNIISKKWEKEIPAIIKEFNRISITFVLESKDDDNVAFQKMLSASIPTKKLRKIFIDTYFANEAIPDKFWNELALVPEFSDGQIIKDTQKVFQLNLLSGHPVIAAQLHKQQENDQSLSNIRAYAKFTKKDFELHITTAETTGALKEFLKGIDGRNKNQKIKNHALKLEDSVARLFPTDVFRHRLSADTGNLFGHSTNDLVTFLDKNPDFDLKTTKINKLFKDAIFRGVRNEDQIKDDLRKVNRVNKLAPNYKNTTAIIKAGMHSAVAIVAKSEAEFVKSVRLDIPADIAKLTYKHAVSTNNRAMAIAVDIKSKQDNRVFAINGSDNVSPDYQSLFGDNRLCNCEHCQSVYSPSAYYVDMLSFIKEHSTGAFNVLNIRRPDLGHILLTCNNTNKVLPYIDLVNEVLESQIQFGTPTAFQTTLTTEELSAFPEHTNSEAYDILAGDFSSFKLPFNLALTETRIYLDQLGCQRYQLMELFHSKQAGSKYNDINIAAEFLGLSSQELANINGTQELVDLTNSSKIEDYLVLTGLTYIELLQVLECKFVNPIANNIRTVTIVVATDLFEEDGITPKIIEETTCNVEFLRFEGLSVNLLKKHLRFIRLWKKLGWNIIDLDRVLNAFNAENATEINDSIIIALSNLTRLKSAFKLSISQLLCFWGDIPKQIYVDHSTDNRTIVSSLYHNLFQNKIISNPLDEGFVDPDNLPGSIADKEEIITAALNISANDFTLLTGKLTPNASLNLVNLSIIYRHTLLAKILKLTISDLLLVLDITGHELLNDETADTLDFIDIVSFIKNSRFSLLELSSLIKTDSSTLPPQDANAIVTLLTTLRYALKEVEQLQFPEAVNEADKIDQRKLVTQNLIANSISSTLNADVSIIEIMLTDMVKFTADNQLPSITPFIATEFIQSTEEIVSVSNIDEITWLHPDLVATYQRLVETWNRLSLLLNTLSISADEFIFLQRNEVSFEIAGIWNISDDNAINEQFERLTYLIELIQFRDSLNKPTEDWYLLFTPNMSETEFNTALEALTGIPTVTQKMITNALNFNFPLGFSKGQNLLQVLDCYNKAKSLGGTVTTLLSLANFTAGAETSSIARNLLKARYDEETWLDVIKPISNQLRSEKRDALTNYLLSAEQLEGFRTNNQITQLNDIFSHFLIDVEMAPCMMTSRIKQAISSVQLFIDRCLMGLEGGLVFDKDFIKQWNEWRKVYRVWQANREIFLYPENWIEPELRDDKSPFFKDLESKLTQNEVTDEIAKEALLEYLHKLDMVANLEIIAFFDDTAKVITHVVGRTKNIPHQYFYRKQKHSIWTAWEKMELDIQGEHLLLVVWNNRLMLFWGEFTDKQKESDGGVSLEQKGNKITSPKPQKYLELKLNWSEYKNEKWAAKKISKGLHINDHSQTKDERRHYQENLLLNSNLNHDVLSIRIIALVNRVANDNVSLGTFIFDNCNSSPSIKKGEDNPLFPGINQMNINSPFLVYFPNSDLVVYNSGIFKPVTPSRIVLLKNNHKKFNLLPNHHEIESDKSDQFFCNNEKNTFFVQLGRELKDRLIDDVKVPDSVMTRKFFEPSPIDTFSNTTGSSAIEVISATIANDFPSLEAIPSPSNNMVSFKRVYFIQTFHHPFICTYIETLNTEGIEALYKSEVQGNFDKLFTANNYNPDPNNVKKPYPVENVDFELSGSNSNYNWELFYYIPLLIASRLSQNKQFEESRKWFHYIFNPTNSIPTTDEGVERFWITKPFKQEIESGLKPIDELLNDADNNNELSLQLTNWESNAFNPHAVARLRNSAYMRSTLMKYIDNLIDWGDQLFRRDSIESINEATQLYILAANLLGEKPENIPARAKPVAPSFDDINSVLDPFMNAKVEIESFLSPSELNQRSPNGSPVLMPLFCLPKNEKLLGYWDKIADKLFKIRHCMNIEGIVRQLPLFQPRIDPALLVRAREAGLDLNTVLNDIQSALPHYRFQIILQKANELCNDVKSLGGQLLATLEKKDAEELSLLRSDQELKLLELIRDIKKLQINEAQENLSGLLAAKAVIVEREAYYGSRAFMNLGEVTSLALSTESLFFQTLQSEAALAASLNQLMPDSKIGSPFSTGFTYGGSNIGPSATIAASRLGTMASILNWGASSSSTIGSYKHRMDDWKFQGKTATLELKQIDNQIIAAEIRLAISEKDLSNHEEQMEQSEKVQEFLQSKFSNAELYHNMVSHISGIYFQTYQMAYDFSKQAEKCYQFELGIEKSNIIKFGHWTNLKQGLSSGESLQFDLRRLESSFLAQNNRELELSKNISIAMLDPLALLELKETGKCHLSLPEELFDFDFQGHYFRRIKAVSVSIPCITGPYTSVNCTLRLIKNLVRKNTLIPDEYVHNNDEGTPLDDDRFRASNVPSTSIATSSGQNDAGMFEFNFRDERYLPFEGAGVISDWQLTLSTAKDLRQFDYDTISDIILHIKYTAKEGSDSFKNAAVTHLRDYFTNETKQPLTQLLNIKNEFPNEWHRFIHPNVQTQNKILKVIIGKQRLPFFTQGSKIEVGKIHVLIRSNFENHQIALLQNEGGSLMNIDLIKDPTFGDLFKAELTKDEFNLDIEREVILTLQGAEAGEEGKEIHDILFVLEYSAL